MFSGHTRYLFQIVMIAVIALSCDRKGGTQAADKTDNPKRCVFTDVGEAPDFIQKKDIEDDALVVAHGLGNPQALVWRDAETNQTYYLARIMGTERRLYFLRTVGDDEQPGVPSRFEGHLLRWDRLPPERARAMAGGLKSQYNVTIKPEETFIIIEGERPDGCPASAE